MGTKIGIEKKKPKSGRHIPEKNNFEDPPGLPATG